LIMKGRKFSVLCIVLVLMMLVPAVLGAAGEDYNKTMN